jgi:hypothetical protein
MSEFKPGEIVDITIKGARVGHESTDGFLGVFVNGVPLTVDLVDAVTVERVAPAEWPPRPGDLWKDRDGFLHFAASYSPDYDDAEDSRGIDAEGCRVVLLSQHSDESCTPGHDMHRPENVNQRSGPLTLVHREDGTR